MKTRVRYEVLEKDGTWLHVSSIKQRDNGWIIWERLRTGLRYCGVAGPGNWRAVEIGPKKKKGARSGQQLQGQE